MVDITFVVDYKRSVHARSGQQSLIGIMGRDRKLRPIDARKFGFDVSVCPNGLWE